MKRRYFLKNTAATSALISLSGLALTSCNQEVAKQLTILHTNDVHSHIEPFSSNHPDYPNLGGIARRASLINRVK